MSEHTCARCRLPRLVSPDGVAQDQRKQDVLCRSKHSRQPRSLCDITFPSVRDPPPRTNGSQDKMISCKIIPCPPDHRDAQERLRLSKRPADTPPQMALRVLGTQRTVTLPAHGWCQMGNFHFLEGPSGPHPSPISSSVKGKLSPPGNAWEFHIHTMWPCAAHLLCWSRNT